MFDLVSAILLTISVSAVIACFTLSFGSNFGERLSIASALTLWLATVVAAGANHWLSNESGLGTPGLGLAFVLPFSIMLWLGLGTRVGRARVVAAPARPLIAVQAVRLIGILFLLLLAAGRLPAPFAPIAGWGDIAIGLTAIPIAALLLKGGHGATVWIWSWLGLADLGAAIALGAMSAAGPVRLFADGPSSAIMTDLPWILIPAFLVPTLAFLHFVTLAQLRTARRAIANDGKLASAA